MALYWQQAVLAGIGDPIFQKEETNSSKSTEQNKVQIYVKDHFYKTQSFKVQKWFHTCTWKVIPGSDKQDFHIQEQLVIQNLSWESFTVREVLSILGWLALGPHWINASQQHPPKSLRPQKTANTSPKCPPGGNDTPTVDDLQRPGEAA